MLKKFREMISGGSGGEALDRPPYALKAIGPRSQLWAVLPDADRWEQRALFY
jgi:hypothetical protein